MIDKKSGGHPLQANRNDFWMQSPYEEDGGEQRLRPGEKRQRTEECRKTIGGELGRRRKVAVKYRCRYRHVEISNRKFKNEKKMTTARGLG